MTRFTAARAAAAVKQMRGLRFRHLVDTGHGSGIVLSTRDDSPRILGFGAVDRDGDAATLALSVEEAEELRNALDAWLTEHQ